MATRSLWNDPEESAVARLDYVVSALSKKHNAQLYVRCVADALFWGLLVAALFVAATRLLGLRYPQLHLTLAAVLPALLMGLVWAWRQGPGKLTSAIVADNALGLKQRLSTAWEFRQSAPDAAITRALAVQAVGRRHAAVTGVFPFQLNLPGVLVPLAVALLLLTSLIELPGQASSPIKQIDALMVEEGTRLKVFAERMKLQAQRQGLSRSLQESGGMNDLASELQAGVMQREEALQRLQSLGNTLATERSAALQDLQRVRNSSTSRALTPSASSSDGAASGLSGAQSELATGQAATLLDQIQGLGLSRLRDKLSVGELSSADLDALERAAKTMRETGSDSAELGQELQQALDQLSEGDSSDLQELLDTLTQAEQHQQDADELDNARVAVSRASENLGGDSLLEQYRIRVGHSAADEAGDAERLIRGDGLSEYPGAQLTAGDGLGRSAARFKVTTDANRAAADLVDDSAATLKPASKTGEGASAKSETWALPEAGAITEDNAQLDARFSQQMESIQAKEQYPLHRKEFLRRYFLNLSNAGAAGDTTGENNK